MILDETETAKYLKIVPPWGDAFNKMARKSKTQSFSSGVICKIKNE